MPKQTLPYVVVVDDERVIAETLTIILNENGFSAVFFTNPLDALESAQTAPPDLLVSDIMMPQLSGIDLAIRMRALCPACKILLFSGQTDTAELLTSARGQGHSFDLLLKPVHPHDFLRKLREQESPSPGEDLLPSPIMFG
jgi:CheY-like chemotaxis protein